MALAKGTGCTANVKVSGLLCKSIQMANVKLYVGIHNTWILKSPLQGTEISDSCLA